MRSEEKYEIYQQHQLTKPCRACGVDESEKWGFVFCDSCDDGYHWKCIDPPLTQEQAEELQCWICPPCLQLQFQQNTIIRDENKSQDCFKCGIPLNITTRFVKMVMTDLYGVQRIVKTPVPLPLIKNCRHCKRLFHSKKCFSKRFNSLNCGQCEQKIRNNGPKTHLQFIAYLKPEIQCIHEMGYIEIKHHTSNIQQQRISYSRLEGIGLQVFQHSGHWQTICRMEASLYYALKSNNLHYCINQLYQNMETMSYNKPTSNIYTPQQLSQSDEEVYEEFRFMTREGYIPPLEIKQDFQKGFYAVAAQYIPKLTLLCEYVGEVRTKRQTIAQHQDNDSIMSLIQTKFAETGLDIVPEKFGNVSKFISGVPEHRTDLMNVQTLNFCYKGRSHVIFFTIKPIESGMTLFIDYNAELLNLKQCIFGADKKHIFIKQFDD